MKWTIAVSFVAMMVFCYLLPEASAGVLGRRTKRQLVHGGPLRNAHTHQRVKDLAEAARKVEDDPNTRLMPRANHAENKTHLFVCCLHANILDFYLRNILNTNETYPHLAQVKTDLHRVSKDLEAKGCTIKHVNDHEHSKKFREDFRKMGEKGKNKAIGEIDILFDYLDTFC